MSAHFSNNLSLCSFCFWFSLDPCYTFFRSLSVILHSVLLILLIFLRFGFVFVFVFAYVPCSFSVQLCIHSKRFANGMTVEASVFMMVFTQCDHCIDKWRFSCHTSVYKSLSLSLSSHPAVGFCLDGMHTVWTNRTYIYNEHVVAHRN